MRNPVRISGSAPGKMTNHSTCARLAPSDWAARMRTCCALFTPASTDIATGAKIAK
ncbi:Uncharacterised protein [Shigella sonnei]|nr:Uncharacterised protein [Shigella sonnei]